MIFLKNTRLSLIIINPNLFGEMIVYKNLNIPKKHRDSVIAIGNFDGLHIGHQKVLKEANQKAKKKKIKIWINYF